MRCLSSISSSIIIIGPRFGALVKEERGLSPGSDMRPLSFLNVASGLSKRSFGLSGRSSRTCPPLIALFDEDARSEESIELKMISCCLESWAICLSMLSYIFSFVSMILEASSTSLSVGLLLIDFSVKNLI